MTTTSIADLLTNTQRDLRVTDDIAAGALTETVKLLKAAIPFLLPVRIVTGHFSPLEIAREAADVPYTQIALKWFIEFATHPKWEVDDLTDFIGKARHVVSDQIEHFLKQKQSDVPPSLRKLAQLECDLCDGVMIRWLSVTNFVRLFDLAFRWDIHCLTNDTQGVLDELGLTKESMLDLPDSEIVRLQLVERIKAENRQHVADFETFLRDDSEGVKLEQIVISVTNAYAAAHGESLKRSLAMTTINEQLKIAADWIRDADGILITAGAGMGVDSGLPDFRGENGFWHAYPALKAEGIGFQDIASGEAFRSNPIRAWGFYGHRLNLYRRTVPHASYDILRRWSSEKEHGAFVFTSNVDELFQKAGFPGNRILECHGSIHVLQCSRACSDDVWSADEFDPEVDEEQCFLTSPLPRCPKCDSVARPNILMFNDWDWIDTRVKRRRMRFEAWLLSVDRMVVIELGAGRAIPTVRNMSERNGPRVIRINTDEYTIDPEKCIGLQGRALDLLKVLDGTLRQSEWTIAPPVPSPGFDER